MAIIKSMTRKTGSYRQLIEYMLKGRRETARTKEEGFIIRHNIRAGTAAGWVKEFEANEAGRKIKRSNSVKIYHDVYAIQNLDKSAVTPAMLRDLAQKYIELRSPDSVCIAVPHFSANPHIHFMFGGVEMETGVSLRISREDFARFKEEMSAYERLKYPQLPHSRVDHGKKQRAKIKKEKLTVKQEKEYRLEKRTKAPSEKERVRLAVEACYERSLSRADFYHRLSAEGLSTYSRNGSVTGIEGERRYRFGGLGYDERSLRELDYRDSAIKGIQVFRDDMEQKQQERDMEDEPEMETERDIPGNAGYKEEKSLEDESDEGTDYTGGMEDELDIDL